MVKVNLRAKIDIMEFNSFAGIAINKCDDKNWYCNRFIKQHLLLLDDATWEKISNVLVYF